VEESQDLSARRRLVHLSRLYMLTLMRFSPIPLVAVFCRTSMGFRVPHHQPNWRSQELHYSMPLGGPEAGWDYPVLLGGPEAGWSNSVPLGDPEAGCSHSVRLGGPEAGSNYSVPLVGPEERALLATSEDGYLEGTISDPLPGGARFEDFYKSSRHSYGPQISTSRAMSPADASRMWAAPRPRVGLFAGVSMDSIVVTKRNRQCRLNRARGSEATIWARIGLDCWPRGPGTSVAGDSLLAGGNAYRFWQSFKNAEPISPLPLYTGILH